MYDPNASYDLAWAPIRYPAMRLTDGGAWRLVLDDSSDPIGIVWTNYSDGAGVVWVVQEPVINKLITHFLEGAQAQTPANYAYMGASLVPGVKLSDETTGPLSGAMDELNSISDELS